MTSSSTRDVIIPTLIELAKTRSPVSQAVSAAVKVNIVVNMVKSDEAEYVGLGEDAIKLLYVVEEEWREKLSTLTRILAKISELAKTNAAMSDVKAFWNSDEDDLRALREELQALLPAFGITSFTELQIQCNDRITQTDNNAKNVRGHYNSSPELPMSDSKTQGHVEGMPRGTYVSQILPNANNPTITGGEFNIVGRDYITKTYGD